MMAGADAPDADEHQARVDPQRVEQPVRRVGDADEPQDAVDPAGLRVEHPLPDEDAGHERHDVGQEEQHPEAGRAAHPGAVEQQRDAQRHDDGDRQPEQPRT